MKTFNTKRTLWTFVILLLVAVTVIISAVTTVADGTQKPVIYIHDGAIDEYVSYLLLSTMDGMDLQGLIIVNADCIDTPPWTPSGNFSSLPDKQTCPWH